jgi:hypothetical protein
MQLDATGLSATSYNISEISATAPYNGMYLNLSSELVLSSGGYDRLLINASGNVGIGTSPGAYTLNVGTGSVNCGNIDSAGDVTASGIIQAPRIQLAGSSATVTNGMFLGVTNVVSFSTDSTERITITANGGVSFGSSGTDYGTLGQVLQSNGDAPPTWVTPSSGGGYSVSVIGTNTTAVKGTLYVLTASLTLTLPASPTAGDQVAVSNLSGTTTAVIGRNGEKIMNLSEDMTIDVVSAGITLVYSGATYGWVTI